MAAAYDVVRLVDNVHCWLPLGLLELDGQAAAFGVQGGSLGGRLMLSQG